MQRRAAPYGVPSAVVVKCDMPSSSATVRTLPYTIEHAAVDEEPPPGVVRLPLDVRQRLVALREAEVSVVETPSQSMRLIL